MLFVYLFVQFFGINYSKTSTFFKRFLIFENFNLWRFADFFDKWIQKKALNYLPFIFNILFIYRFSGFFSTTYFSSLTIPFHQTHLSQVASVQVTLEVGPMTFAWSAAEYSKATTPISDFHLNSCTKIQRKSCISFKAMAFFALTCKL